MASPQLISEATAFISKWPQCIQADLIKGFVASNCGADVQCICKNKIFGLLLIDGTRNACSVADAICNLPFRLIIMSHRSYDMIVEMCPMLNESRKPIAIAAIAVTTTLALISVMMRIASRRVAGTKLWIDDYLIMVAMAVALGETANIAILIYAGLGKHFVALNVDQQVLWLKAFWVLEFLYSWSMTLIKFAIVVFYHRVFSVKRSMRITVYVISVFLVAWCLAQVFYIVLECTPIAKFWDYKISTGHCNSDQSTGYAINGASLVLDLVIFVAAIPPLWGLSKSLADRLSLIGIFLVGGMVCIAGAVRMPLIVNLDLTDLPWSATDAVIWLQIETKIGIVSACLPMLSPVVKSVWKFLKTPSFVSRLHTSKHSRKSNSQQTFSSQQTLVTDRPEQRVRRPTVADLKTAGSPVIAQSASGNEDDEERALWKRRASTNDWYSMAVRNISISEPNQHSESSESPDFEKKSPVATV